MRCYCCNNILTPAETNRKFASGAFTEMCNKCLSTIDEDVILQEDSYDASQETFDDED